MKELNQQEMELVAGAGWKERAKQGIHAVEQFGEAAVDGLEAGHVISHETAARIKAGLKSTEEALDNFIDAMPDSSAGNAGYA